MKKSPSGLLLAALLAPIAALAGAAPTVIHLENVSLAFHPDTGKIMQGDAALTGAALWRDSKGVAAHLNEDEVLKIYSGPRYAKDWAREQADVSAFGEREMALMTQWAKDGLALPIRSSGTTSDGTPYAVYQKPRTGFSLSNYIRKNRYSEIASHAEEMARRLVAGGWELKTFNPTQLYVQKGPERGARTPRLIKAYQYDARTKPGADPAELEAHYRQRLDWFAALSDMYKVRNEGGPALSDGIYRKDPTQIALMVFEALRTGRKMRLDYVSGGTQTGAEKIKSFTVQPMMNSLKKDDFMKGYIRVKLFGTEKEYTFRLDNIVGAEFAAS